MALKHSIKLWFFILAVSSCSKLELINPKGLELKIDCDSVIFAEIGDFGYSGENERKVAEMVKSWNPDFIITGGDNNYNEGKLSTLKDNIGHYYGDFIYNYDAPPELRCNGRAFTEQINRFFPTPGNHDANNRNGLIPYYNYFTLPGNESYYTFVWGPVTFFSINTEEDLTEQKIWLEHQLEQVTTPFRVVFFHKSPYSDGPHGNFDPMQWNFSDMKIDVVFTGHDHIYNRIQKEGEEQVYYVVNGLGGKEKYKCDKNLQSPEFTSFCYDEDYGAIKATVTPKKMIVEFYSIHSGSEPVDRIVIEK